MIGVPARRLYAVLVLAFFGAADVSAQSHYMQVAREFGHPRAFHEVAVLPRADSAQALVMFRVPNSLLVFVQQEDGFAAHPEVTVTLYRDGKAVDERIWRGRQTAASFDATQSQTEDAQGFVTFQVMPGMYAYELSLSDDISGSVGTARRRTFEVVDFSTAVLGDPFFSQISSSGSETTLQPANVGGDVPFGAPMPIAVPLHSLEQEDRLTYQLFRLERDGRERRARSEYDRDDAGALISGGQVDAGNAVRVGKVDPSCLCWTSGAFGLLVPIDLSAEELENDVYLLEVTLERDGARYATTSVFSTLWRDMPLSLYDPEVAIRNLEFIESRDEVRSMLRGSRDERIEKFRSFWRQRDPTPGTVFNELMAEYYRRVDLAARRFQTGRTPHPDGLQTDAARVFIVHGPPDDVANSFPSSGGVEQVWTYPDGRQFVFWAASSLDALELREERETPASGN